MCLTEVGNLKICVHQEDFLVTDPHNYAVKFEEQEDTFLDELLPVGKKSNLCLQMLAP